MSLHHLTIVGGTYLESCLEPEYFELYGSGLRAAAALSSHVRRMNLFSCIGDDQKENARSICKTFAINETYYEISQTIEFAYHHPLSTPGFDLPEQITKYRVAGQNVLYFGMIEAIVAVDAKRLVYDPQNHIAFDETGSSAESLAIVLNANEAKLLSGATRKRQSDLGKMGKEILRSSGAEVVVIKNGVFGAIVIERTKSHHVPVYETQQIWPIGSGDIFSAVFALNWAVKQKSALRAANLASCFAAHYCQNPTLPLPKKPATFGRLPRRKARKRVYLAGPFFSFEERWMIGEVFEVLTKLGANVFSPFHHIGLAVTGGSRHEQKQIAQEDLREIIKSDLVFALLNRPDPGTLFEIGFARANKVKVMVFSQNLNSEDRLMLVGSGCEILGDLSTAAYRATW